MKSLILHIIIFTFIIKFVTNATETKEKELFRIRSSTKFIQFDIIENTNKYNYLFVQIILCQFLSKNSHISIENEMGEKLFDTDVISSRNFIVNITEQNNNSLIINATSNDMYVQYQYLEEDKNSILASGFIDNYDFGNNYITFNISPVVNNTETTYDLYYLGKINIYNDICQKIDFILENSPIANITMKGYNYFDLKFENIEHKTGYYLVKGNNVNDVSYYYFYERINVVNRLGPFKTESNQFFEVKSESDEYYSIFTTPGNIENKKYLNLQIILCEPFGEQKSHISILDENNQEIFFSDIIVSRQTDLDLYPYQNITFMTTSPHMYIQYQFTDIYYYVYPYGIIKSYDLNLDNHSIHFNVTPVTVGTSSNYELYYERNKSLISNECSKLEYTLHNEPISTLNVLGNDDYIDLNFSLNLPGERKNEEGFVFIKSKNVDEINYAYFYKEVNVTINYESDSPTLLLVFLFIIIGVCIIAVFVVIYILFKQGICSREESEENQKSISLINRINE